MLHRILPHINRTGLAALQTVVVLGAALQAAPPSGYRLAWSDEFDGAELDASKWSHWGVGARRDALNTPDAVTVGGGHLTIRTYTAGGRHYTAMVATRNTFLPLYGYIEARIDFDDSPGMWSAFWVQSPTMGKPVGDPGTAGTEIDVCEHRRTSGSGSELDGKVQHTLHWDGYGDDHKSRGHLTGNLGLGSGFHTYGIEWTETAYRYYVDGQLTWSLAEAVSNRSQFIILSSEVQDDSWAGRIPAGGYGDLSTSTTRMRVDYVRYYASPSWIPPPPPPPATTLVARGADWKYLAASSGAPSGWMRADFDDAAWPGGPAELGYGDGDEATTVPFGSSASSKWITTYFRRSFTAWGPGAVTDLLLHLKRDDGAVVYLNGVEANRSNMPRGPISRVTLASSRVDGSDEDVWHEAALDPSLLSSGTNVVAVEVHQVLPASSDISFDLSLEARSVLVGAESGWKYFAGPAAPGGPWRSLEYDDAAWPAGPAELGYGDGDEATTVPFGGNSNDRWITTYFRRVFTAGPPGGAGILILRLKCDDGAVVYLNGVEAHRENMPAGAIGHDTPAASTISEGEELQWLETSLDPSLLRSGPNVVAVEVHQVSASSSDLTFDLSLSELVATGTEPPGARFLRGDANDDAGVDISDASRALNWLFLGSPAPGCIAAVDANGDGSTDISDAIYLLDFLFLGGSEPVPPYPACGPASLETDTALGCDTPPAQCP